MESRQGSNEFRKADLVLANIVREVYVLEEHISDTTGGGVSHASTVTGG